MELTVEFFTLLVKALRRLLSVKGFIFTAYTAAVFNQRYFFRAALKRVLLGNTKARGQSPKDIARKEVMETKASFCHRLLS